MRTLVALALALSVAATAATELAALMQVAMARYGSAGRDAVQLWREVLNAAGDQPEQDRLTLVNEFFNRRIRFQDDIEIWGQPDYWATPLETLGRNAGDCEDFSIAKYVSLRLAGVPAEKMRLIYVRARIGGPDSRLSQAHMVLGYYATPNAEPLVLDNLISDIRPASRRGDLFPIFSFNGQGLWVGGAQHSSADPTERLSRWRDLLARMRDDGLE